MLNGISYHLQYSGNVTFKNSCSLVQVQENNMGTQVWWTGVISSSLDSFKNCVYGKFVHQKVQVRSESSHESPNRIRVIFNSFVVRKQSGSEIDYWKIIYWNMVRANELR